MDTYDNPFSKIALTLTATQVAKNMITKAEGVGEDLSFNFFAWRGDIPILCVQLESKYMKEPHEKRFYRCKDLIDILRFKVSVTSLTFICEGYVAPIPQQKELSIAFIEPYSGVKECLTVIHCDENSYGPADMYLFSMPYSYGLGKHVIWGNLMEFSQNAVDTIKNYKYPMMMRNAFSHKIDKNNTDLGVDDLVLGKIVDCGFLIQQF